MTVTPLEFLSSLLAIAKHPFRIDSIQVNSASSKKITVNACQYIKMVLL